MKMEDEYHVPPPSDQMFRLRWDVFISFGGDTRDGFAINLYNELKKSKLRVFMDNDALNQGYEIAEGLVEAIEDSAASIIVISPKYASSRWCLDELSKICENRRLFLPVFYCVDPSDVRRLKGPFEKDFSCLEDRLGEKQPGQVRKWREAMEKVGGTSGFVFKESMDEAKLIQNLVSGILKELSNTPVHVTPYTVGLDFPLKELLSSLDVKSNGVRVLGLYGTGGIGKTTLAKALFNKLASHFEFRSFISNVRENFAQEHDILCLQNKLLRELSSGNVRSVNDLTDGKAAIERLLIEKRVLIILDDLESVAQLNSLVGGREWLYEGSRLIITTRDTALLEALQVDEMCEVRGLGSSESLKLFCYHAMRREKPPKLFSKLAKDIVSLTGGLPLALEVFGSSLFDKRREEEWEDAAKKLAEIRPINLQDVLMLSYKGLDTEEKCIFLDIACLLVNQGVKKDYVIDIMKGCGFRAETAVTTLIKKSLVKVVEEDKLWMHDQVRDMGRQIVLENVSDPGECSRLWNRADILSVLKKDKGTESIEGMILDFENKNFQRIMTAKTICWNNLYRSPSFTSVLRFLKEIYKEYFQHSEKKEEQIVFSTESFKPMKNLRLLQLSDVKLEGSFRNIPAELKWLQWRRCPLKNLPSSFCPREVTVLDLSESNIQSVWGWKWWWLFTTKAGEKLIVLNLHGCYNLTDVPDLSKNHALEKLILERCSILTTIHKSIGDLITLRHLNLRDCSNLVKFPDDVSGLYNLEILILSGCSRLKELPKKIGEMKSLRELLVDKTAVESLPDSVSRLTELKTLSLNGCRGLKRLPDCIGNLGSLRELSLDGSAVEELPNSIGSLSNLESLSLIRCEKMCMIPDSVCKLKSLSEFRLTGTSVSKLPDSIGSLSYLKHLALGSCSSICVLPHSIEGLASIVSLQLDGTSITGLPDQICGLKSLKKLEMQSCKSLLSLPESITKVLTLTQLIITHAAISELPEEIGDLENLTMLKLNGCKKLKKLPSSIGKLKSLCRLIMEKTSMSELPNEFGMLSSLVVLKMAKEIPTIQNAEEENHDDKKQLTVLPSSFSKLSLLEEFDARGWRFSGKLPDDFNKLSSLETLNLGHNDFCSLPASLQGLSILEKLLVPNCRELRALPLLPSSLVEINAANCTSLERISDMSNLENLQELNISNCEKLEDLPGVECLKSLNRLHMSGCSLCASVVKGKLDKVALKNLYNLTMPGSEIPDWLTEGVVRFSKRKNNKIKFVIVCVVISINNQMPEDFRDKLPVVPDIEAKIVRVEKPVYCSVMYLPGVPKTDEDQLYLCRYSHHHPLVSILEHDDELRVEMRNPPFCKGIELKKCGIHLVFDKDDDYDGDEDFVEESKQTVSAKLTKFIGTDTSAGEDHHRPLLESYNSTVSPPQQNTPTIWDRLKIL